MLILWVIGRNFSQGPALTPPTEVRGLQDVRGDGTQNQEITSGLTCVPTVGFQNPKRSEIRMPGSVSDLLISDWISNRKSSFQSSIVNQLIVNRKSITFPSSINQFLYQANLPQMVMEVLDQAVQVAVAGAVFFLNEGFGEFVIR